MKNIFSILVFVSFFGSLFSQELVVLDSFYRGRVRDLVISNSGERYYSFSDMEDSISFNDFSAVLPKERSVGGSVSFNSTSYIFAFTKDGHYKYHKQGMRGVTLIDSKVLSSTAFTVDTLYTTDTFFINASRDYGTNQVLHVFDQNGNFIDFKHWQSIEGLYGFGIIGEYEDQHLVMGYLQYYGNDSVYIDDIVVPYQSGEIEGFLGWMSKDDYTLEEIILLTEGEHELAWYGHFVLEEDKLILSGLHSEGSSVIVCNDTISRDVGWGSSSAFLLLADTEGNCITNNAPKGGSSGTKYFGALSHGKYLWHGYYYGYSIDWNGVKLERPSLGIKSCLYVFDQNLQAIRAWQIETSYGTAAIHDSQIDKNGNIWIVGWTEDSALSLGAYDMVLDPQYSRLNFIAKLDPDFNVLWAEGLGALSLGGFYYGADDNIYVRGTPFIDTLRYSETSYTFRIDDPFVSNEEEGLDALIMYPNPAAEYLYITLEGSIKGGDLVIYNLLGQLVHQEWIKENDNTKKINTSSFEDGIYIIQIRDKEKQIVFNGKFVKA